MISLVFAAALAAGAPAEPPAATPPAVATPAPAAASATPAAKADKSKGGLVCKTEQVVGSRLPVRVCLSQEDWNHRRDNSRDELRKAQRGQPYNSN